jgi:hypothetical protein
MRCLSSLLAGLLVVLSCGACDDLREASLESATSAARPVLSTASMLLSTTSSQAEHPPAAALGSLRLRGDPAPALVFVDGRFVGELSAKGELEIVREAGPCEVRVSEAGYLDAVETIGVEAGVATAVEITLAKFHGSAKVPDRITLGVGQPARVALVKNPEGVVLPQRYLIHEEFIPRRLLVVNAGTDIRFEVLDPDGKAVSVRAVPRPEGSPGATFFEFDGSRPGDYTMLVHGAAGPCSFRYLQAPPPRTTTATEPALKLRRVAPTAPSKN